MIAEADRLLDALLPARRGPRHADVTAYRRRRRRAGRGDRGRGRRAGRPGAVRRVPRRSGRAGGRAAAPPRPARRADHRRRAPGRPPAPRATSRTSCWSRRSPRSSTWRTPSPPSTARTRSAAYRTWLGLMTGELDGDASPRAGRRSRARVNGDRDLHRRRRLRAGAPRAARCCSCATSGTTCDSTPCAPPTASRSLEECLDIAGLHVAAAARPARARAATPTPAPAASTSSSRSMHGPDEVGADRRPVRRRGGGARLPPDHPQDRDHGRGEAHVGQPRGLHRPRRGPRDLRQHRVPRPHRRRDPLRLRGRPGGPQGRR